MPKVDLKGFGTFLATTALLAPSLDSMKLSAGILSRVKEWQFSIFHLTQFLSRESTVSTIR